MRGCRFAGSLESGVNGVTGHSGLGSRVVESLGSEFTWVVRSLDSLGFWGFWGCGDVGVVEVAGVLGLLGFRGH